MIMELLNCPKGHGPMAQINITKQKTFKGVDIEYSADAFICPECGLEAGTVQSAGDIQRAIADAYRKKIGLLTGQEIRSLREAKELTQQQLADVMNVGIASIKRWENGMIQTKSMDHALRIQLQYTICADGYTGNREISLPRIKLVAETFERTFRKRLLKSGDKLLFLAKYLWYADMLAFRQLGRGLTGASYAAMTYGPQLNNYRELVKSIRESNIKDAEMLSEEELRVIHQVADKFPDERQVYDAAHRERVWRESKMGALIPYTCANDLSEF
jgi:putative zinc finger/helix-turn-helix YgiT family protein